jgi:hypothetical protein
MRISEGEVPNVSLGLEIQALSGRIHADLLAAHDYYHHARLTWRLLRARTRRGGRLTVRNPTTGTIVDAAQLADLSKTYEKFDLAESVFQHFVALFEDFVFEFLRLWLTAYPGGIPNKDKKPVELATVIDAPDREAILQGVIGRELNAPKYERPTAWFRYLNDRVKLGCPTDDQIERFTEIKATRDILAHNRGVVNPTYLDKAGRHARYQLGQRLEIPEPYLHDAWLLIRQIVEQITTAAVAKT